MDRIAPFTKKDTVFVLILGELVGLLAYVIVLRQAAAADAGTLVRGLAANAATLPALALGVPLAAFAALILTYLLGKRIRPAFFQFGKFAVVGFANTAIYWTIINVLVRNPESVSNLAYYLIASVAFIASTSHSFIWNKFWSFEKKSREHIKRESFEFFVVTGGGFLINTGVATLVKSLGPATALWVGIAAPAAATATTMFWNFFGYKLVVFGKRNEAAAAGQISAE